MAHAIWLLLANCCAGACASCSFCEAVVHSIIAGGSAEQRTSAAACWRRRYALQRVSAPARARPPTRLLAGHVGARHPACPESTHTCCLQQATVLTSLLKRYHAAHDWLQGAAPVTESAVTNSTSFSRDLDPAARYGPRCGWVVQDQHLRPCTRTVQRSGPPLAVPASTPAAALVGPIVRHLPRHPELLRWVATCRCDSLSDALPESVRFLLPPARLHEDVVRGMA
jgi:hypothetical protein